MMNRWWPQRRARGALRHPGKEHFEAELYGIRAGELFKGEPYSIQERELYGTKLYYPKVEVGIEERWRRACGGCEPFLV